MDMLICFGPALFSLKTVIYIFLQFDVFFSMAIIDLKGYAISDIHHDRGPSQHPHLEGFFGPYGKWKKQTSDYTKITIELIVRGIVGGHFEENK